MKSLGRRIRYFHLEYYLNVWEVKIIPVVFQQNSVSSHVFRPVWSWLDQAYPGLCTDTRQPLEWPARSPDLTPLSIIFSFWLYQNVYVTQPGTIWELNATKYI